MTTPANPSADPAPDHGPPAPPSGAAPARPRRARRLLGVLAAGLALAAAAAGGALWWLADQPAALAAWLNRVPGLTVQGLSGGLRQPALQVERLRWQSPDGAVLQVDGLRLADWSWRWRPHAGAWVGVQAKRLAARQLHWRSGPPATTPRTPPADLRLPLALAVDQLAIDRLQLDDGPVLTGLGARVALGADQGRSHRVDGLVVHADPGTAAQPAPLALRGAGQIASTAPFTLQAELVADGRWQPPGRPVAAWRARLTAAGALAAPEVEAALHAMADGRAAGRADGSAGRPADAGAQPLLTARATVQPFAAWPLGRLSLRTDGLDLQALVPAWPQTALSGEAEVDTRGRDQPIAARLDLTNARPGPWDAGRLPLRRLALDARGALPQPDRLALEQFSLQLGDAAGPAGVVTGQGRWQGDRLELDLALRDLQPARLHRAAAALQLGGPLRLRWTGAAAGGASPPQLVAEGALRGRPLGLPGEPVALDLAARWQPGDLRIEQASAQAGAAAARLTGQVQWDARHWRLASSGRLVDFDPRPWWRGGAGSAWQRGPHRLQGDWQIDLRGPVAAPGAGWLARLGTLTGEAQASLRDSRLAGVPLDGQLQWRRGTGSASAQGLLALAGNRLQAQAAAGADGLATAPWTLGVQAPQLAALAPLAPLLAELAPGAAAFWPTAGALQAEGTLRRGGDAWQTQGTLTVNGLRTPELALGQAQGRWQLGSRANDPLTLSLDLRALSQGVQRLDTLSLRAEGSAASHKLRLQADSPARLPAWTENLLGPAGTGSRLQWQGQGGWQPAVAGQPARYQLQAGQLALGAREAGGGSRAWLAAQDLAARLAWTADGQWQGLDLAPGRLLLAATTALRWQTLRWEADTAAGPGQLTVSAELERFDVAPLLARLQPDMGWGGDLNIGGRIALRSGQRVDADIVLERGGGDLTLTDELGGVQALGISELRLALGAHDGLWQFAQGLAGSSFGTLAGAQLVRTAPGRWWPQAGDPLQGVLQARVANLGAWGTWVPPGWRLSGALDTQGVIGGSFGAPELSGSMAGRGLGVRNMLQGVDLSDGELSVVLAGDTTRIERFRFKGGDGELRLSGGATLGAQPALQLALEAERFKLLGRVDRRLVVSGRSTLRLQRDALQVEGRLRIDEGLFDVSRGEAPTLDADVVVHRRPGDAAPPAAEARPAAPVPAAVRQAQVALDIDLGEQLRLRGRGVDTGLRGQLRLAWPEGRPQLTGTVRTHQGRYAAYAQKLEIRRGEFLFNGPVDNPRLDILALRPNLDVEVGVAITGPAISPRVRLYSEPDMTDYEKLSWLMLGRSSDGLGNADTALLQRAALAMLGGDQGAPADQLLEAIGLTDFSVRQSGSETNRETIVSLGKQLTRRWYVGYERGVNATLGTWQLVYRIAQRFTLRAQSGSENAVDLIWTWRW